LLLLADNVGFGVPSVYNGGILDTPTPRITRASEIDEWKAERSQDSQPLERKEK